MIYKRIQSTNLEIEFDEMRNIVVNDRENLQIQKLKFITNKTDYIINTIKT